MQCSMIIQLFFPLVLIAFITVPVPFKTGGEFMMISIQACLRDGSTD